ncbi:hypothetical protein ACF0H5_014978 [Mactra antiquata]
MTATELFKLSQANFTTYKQLEYLDLFNTSLTGIVPGTFDNLSRLKHLNLSNNEQIPFTKNTTDLKLFAGLTNLVSLRIYGNTGTYNQGGYPGEALKQIPNLQELWIDGMDDSFGKEFQNMTSLTKIVIPGDVIYPPWRFCNIENLTSDIFENLHHVSYFAIRMCGIKYVHPATFRNMTSLTYLDLSQNSYLTIKRAFESFDGLKNSKLQVLVINGIENSFQLKCGITLEKDLVKKTTQLKHLKEVHIENNAINGFQFPAISYLPQSIERIYARNNEFELGIYSFEMYYLQNLEYIDVSHNFFSEEDSIWRQNEPKIKHAYEYGNGVIFNTEKIGVSSKADIEDSFSKGKIDIGSDPNNGDIFMEMKIDLSKVISYLMSGVNRYQNIHEHFNKFMERDRLFRSGELQEYNNEDDHSVCSTKTRIPPACIVANIPPRLKYIDVSFSKLAHPVPEFYFNSTNDVRIVNATDSLIYCWDGPLHGVTTVEYLDLSKNYCTAIRKSFFDSIPNLKALSVEKNLLYIDIQQDTQGRILQALSKLEDLNMAYNRIEKLPRNFLINQSALETLNLSMNLLTEFDIEILHMERIKTIDLYKNHIYTLSEGMRKDLETVSQRSQSETAIQVQVNMAENPIQCYCNNVDFVKWVRDHTMSCKFLNVTITQCYFYDKTLIQINNFSDLDDIVSRLEKYCTSYTTIIIAAVIVLFVIVNIIVGVVVHRFRWKIRYWYYVASRNIKTRQGYTDLNSVESRFKFDVYIALAEETRQFVFEKMKNKLEENNFRTFTQDDILPGQVLYSVITNAIHVSRAVIFVISKACEENKEWKIAMRMAHEESLNRGKPIFFGVLMDTCRRGHFCSDINEVIKRSCIEYPGEDQPANEQTFWQELMEKIQQSSEDQVLSINTSAQP